jgi:purine-nucleoside phosphorylase
VDRVNNATQTVRRWLGDWRPELALVLGSGLGDLADRLEQSRRLPYDTIPGFAVPGVPGHRGELVAGRLASRRILVQSGRFHAYEGHAAEAVALPVRVFADLGVKTLLLTNAAGGIGARLRAGSLMLLADHLNLSFANPLFGPVRTGDLRFPDMSAPYDPDLRRTALAVAREQGISLVEGTYAGVSGPSYETPAEIRMLRRLGADAVGMSTVLEVVAARAAGMRCLAISIITNLAAGLGTGLLSHAEVMTAARAAGDRLERIVTGLVSLL